MFGITRVAVFGQLFVPVPDFIAQGRCDRKLVIDAQFDHAVNVAQAFLHFKVALVLQAPRKGGDDLLARQTVAARATHRQDEGKAELGFVVVVKPLQRAELVRRTAGQPRPVLFMGRFSRQVLADHGLAGQFRVRLDQGDLRRLTGVLQHARQDVFQMRQRAERARVQRFVGDPG